MKLYKIHGMCDIMLQHAFKKKTKYFTKTEKKMILDYFKRLISIWVLYDDTRRDEKRNYPKKKKIIKENIIFSHRIAWCETKMNKKMLD